MLVVCLRHQETVAVCLKHQETVVVCLRHQKPVVVCLRHQETVVVCLRHQETVAERLRHIETVVVRLRHRETVAACLRHRQTVVACLRHRETVYLRHQETEPQTEVLFTTPRHLEEDHTHTQMKLKEQEDWRQNRRKTEFVAIVWPTKGFNGRTFGSTGLSAKGTLISASAVPQRVPSSVSGNKFKTQRGTAAVI